MKSKHFLSIALVLGFTLLARENPFAQAQPNTLRLTSKVRDFLELPNADAANPGKVNFHPDFNTYGGCSRTGYVDAVIDTLGDADVVNFPNDNRTPKLLNRVANCYESIDRFNQWYNDRDATINRSFLYDLVFHRNGVMYEYANSNFFPLDNDSLTTNDPGLPGQKITRPLKGANTTTFGHLNLNDANLAKHNFGFTTEFHATFTYIAADATHPAQVFNFTGDDDVWVFIDGKLKIDLGGVHSALTQGITLDNATATAMGLVNGKPYILDFFLAERHITQSNCRITTSLVLETQKVSAPTADPAGKAFNSLLAVKLATVTPGATIYYTTNGATPDSTSTPYDPAKPISITGTTTLKAIAYKAGWQKSEVMTEVYTKNFTASILDILDQNGNPLAGGYLTELNTAYTIKVTTTQAGLNSISTNATTKTAGDAETVTISNPLPGADNFVFSGTEPLSIAVAANGDGKSQAATYDSLIVRWVNPSDPTKDIAEKRVLVRPAPKQARAYFSTLLDGSLPTDQFAGTETTIYLFVVDQVLPAGAKPQVTIVTTPKIGSVGRTSDVETFDLVAVPGSPGLYRIAITVENNTVSAKGDKKLQLSLGDQITGTYKDPVDTEADAVANAGFGIPPEIDAQLQFTDKNFNVLPAGVYYSPLEGALYLQLKDDYVAGSIATKSVAITIVNNSGKGAADQETFNITLNLAKHTGSTGVWEGSIKLADHPAIKKNNDTAETYILGEVHASVTSHAKDGAPAALASDDLLVAYPNQDAVIKINGPGGDSVSVSRNDSTLIITIKDQSISTAKDTLYFNLSCAQSKDVIVNVMAIETSPGVYVSTIIGKTEGALLVDNVLQCKDRDLIRVSYDDPVYKDNKIVEVLLDNPVTARLYFSSKADGSDEITRVDDLSSDFFYAVVVARSPNVAAVDTFSITFTTAQGETETFKAIETGPYTQKFIVKVPFGFVTTGIGPNNGALEGKITPTEVNNLITANGKVTVEGTEYPKSIDLIAGYAPIKKAYIKDTDGDGKADKVYIEFDKRLGRLPTDVIAQWNDTTSAGKTATGGKISFLNADSNIIVADYLLNEFTVGLTSPAAGQQPKATLPNDALFKGQKPVIEDSIGPVIISAVKKPANATVTNDPSINHDTLVVVLSEPLKTADFREMIKFASSCNGYGHAVTVVAVEAKPNPNNPNEYIIIVDNNVGASPGVGDCVFINADPGKYSDIPGNVPPKYGVELKGANGKKLVQLFRGFPPVAGLDPNLAVFQVAVQDSRDSTKGGYASVDPLTGKYAVNWIPPAGFDATNPSAFDTYLNGHPVTLDQLPSGTAEATDPVGIPETISAIQVVTTAPYIATVTIFDIYGNFVRKSIQAFGAHGEMQNDNRIVRSGKGGRVSFLVWDMKDSHGQMAGNGVYVWKVSFQFKGGKQEVQYTRTGLMRKPHK